MRLLLVCWSWGGPLLPGGRPCSVIDGCAHPGSSTTGVSLSCVTLDEYRVRQSRSGPAWQTSNLRRFLPRTEVSRSDPRWGRRRTADSRRTGARPVDFGTEVPKLCAVGSRACAVGSGACAVGSGPCAVGSQALCGVPKQSLAWEPLLGLGTSCHGVATMSTRPWPDDEHVSMAYRRSGRMLR